MADLPTIEFTLKILPKEGNDQTFSRTAFACLEIS
jgi:hypothetical protein